MLGPDPSPLQQKLAGAATLAVIVFLGLLAYSYLPASDLAGKGVYICGGALLLGVGVGWGIARLFRGRTPDPVVDAVAFWVGALVTYPGFRYIHAMTDWALYPGAGEYTIQRHALAMLAPAALFFLGQFARRR
jgi:hypothetical protein